MHESSAVAEMAAQRCTSGIMQRWGGSVLGQKFGERRASEAISHCPKQIFWLGLHIYRRHYGYGFSWFNVVGSENYRFDWNDAKNDLYAVQGHSRSSFLAPIENPYASSCYWITETYILSRTVHSQNVADYWSNFRCRQGMPSLMHSCSWIPKLGITKFWPQETRYNMVKAYFDTLNRLGVSHECDRRTDGRTDIQTDRETLS